MFFGSAMTLGTVEAFLGVLLVLLSCLIKLSFEEGPYEAAISKRISQLRTASKKINSVCLVGFQIL
jgi:hypothetical protein